MKAVERFVTSEIRKAEEKSSPVLFTRYAAIPDVVEKCNTENNLGFGPDKLAKCGKVVLLHIVYFKGPPRFGCRFLNGWRI